MGAGELALLMKASIWLTTLGAQAGGTFKVEPSVSVMLRSSGECPGPIFLIEFTGTYVWESV